MIDFKKGGLFGPRTTPGSRDRDPRARASQEQVQIQKQALLQICDDIWERTINSLERLEAVTEGYRNISATRLDRHTDKDAITESELDVQTEVHLQIVSLRTAIRDARDEVQWMVQDFLQWLGAREEDPPRSVGLVDRYAPIVLQCLLGQPFTLPTLPDVPLSQKEMLKTLEIFGGAQKETDDLIEQFQRDPDRPASQTTHVRATEALGLRRLVRLEEPWAADFVRTRAARVPAVPAASMTPGETEVASTSIYTAASAGLRPTDRPATEQGSSSRAGASARADSSATGADTAQAVVSSATPPQETDSRSDHMSQPETDEKVGAPDRMRKGQGGSPASHDPQDDTAPREGVRTARIDTQA